MKVYHELKEIIYHAYVTQVESGKEIISNIA